MLRQTPGSLGIWRNYQFFVNTDVEDYHFWVCYEAPMSVARGTCDPNNLVFISVEPPSIRFYPKSFLDQFGTVITCHPYVQHRDVRFTQVGVPWYFGSY